MSIKATFQPILSITIKATSDLAVNRFVETTGRQCRSEMKSIGVSQNDCLNGEWASVIVVGTALVLANEAITSGSDVSSDSMGRAINTGTSATINAIALSDAEVGELVKVLIP